MHGKLASDIGSEEDVLFSDDWRPRVETLVDHLVQLDRLRGRGFRVRSRQSKQAVDETGQPVDLDEGFSEIGTPAGHGVSLEVFEPQAQGGEWGAQLVRRVCGELLS